MYTQSTRSDTIFIESVTSRTDRRTALGVSWSQWSRSALACQRPLLASLRFADAVAPTAMPADQSTPTPSTLVVVESSIRKFAREDVARAGAARASFVRPAVILSRRSRTDRPPGRTSESTDWEMTAAAPTSSSQLGGQNHQSLDQCNQHAVRAGFRLSLCSRRAVYKDAAL